MKDTCYLPVLALLKRPCFATVLSNYNQVELWQLQFALFIV
jgi:hypothetical protein